MRPNRGTISELLASDGPNRQPIRGAGVSSARTGLKTRDRNGARSELATLVQTVERQHQVRADIGKLQTGLGTNDLQAARQGLSDPQGMVGQRPELQPLAQALQSADLAGAVFAGARTAFTPLFQDLYSEIAGSAPPALSPAENVTAEPGPPFPGICPASILLLGLHFGGRRFATLLTAATKSCRTSQHGGRWSHLVCAPHSCSINISGAARPNRLSKFPSLLG